MTSQQYQMNLFGESEVLTLSVEDFRAKLSRLQENEKVLKILEELSSLKLQGSHLFSDHAIYSLRTSKDCLTTKGVLRSRQSSEPWMNSGMMWNGKCLTLKTTYHRTGSEYSLSDILEENVPEKFFLSKKNDRAFTKLQGQQNYANTLTTRIEAQGTGTYVIEREQHEEKIAIPVLTPDRLEKRQNGRRFKDDGEEMFTLTAQDRHGIMVKEATSKGYAEALPGDSVNISHPNSNTRRGRVGKGIANTLLTGEEQAVVTNNFRIRKLTPRECWRLQGFPDWAFDKSKEVNSDSQLYKQAGNSVTVPVIADIASRLESE